MPLPPSPIQPLKNIIREGRQQVRKASDDIRSLAGEMHSTVGSKPAQPTSSETKIPTPATQKQSAPSMPQTSPLQAGLSTEETVTYQNREIGKQLLSLEAHYAQRMRIMGIPCDCGSSKHLLYLEQLCAETIPMVADPSIYEKMIKWVRENEPKSTDQAAKGGKYDDEYPVLSGQARDFRKELMGTTAFGALLTPKERTSVAERATWILGEEEL